MKVVYESNNSGGRWWLTDHDWHNLESAGWTIKWCKDDAALGALTPYMAGRWKLKDGRWLGTLARSASREGLSLGHAIKEWEAITGRDSSELGCSCCGCPHSFVAYSDNGEYAEFYSPDFPKTGNKYKGD